MNRLASRGVRRISWAMAAATWVVGAGLATCLPAGAQSAERPNILWLIAEDFGNDLGCTGVAEASTPRIDALARNGMRFSRFFTTCPVCSPSRSAFMTGMYQTTIGAHNHRSHRHDDHRLPDGVRLLTEWFRDAGYYTANVVELPPEAGFRGTGKTDWNFTPPERPFDGDRWSDLAGHQPFFAQINFQETHRKFNGTKRADPAKVEVPPYEPDHPVARADRAAYLDAGTELDRKVGVVLDQLKRDGLADSTIVVLFGDNGEAHVRGKQFCYEEGLHTPLVIRWPSKFPVPANYARGAVDDRLLMSIDLAPTMLSLAGADVPDAMQGDVFLGDATAPARKYVFAGRDRCDETVFRFRTVRDDRYRYIRNFTPDRPFLQANRYKESQYPVWSLLKELDGKGELTPAQQALTAPTMPAEELYDLESDPHEIHNLAGDAAHAETLARMRGELERWIDESNDQGRIPETEEVIRREGSPRRVPARQSR